MTLIAAGTAVLDGTICRPAWVQTTGDRITGCGDGTPPRPADVELPEHVIVPGFVDMHVHGGGGASYTDGVRDDVARAAAFHLRHGTTTTLASMVTASPDRLLDAVRTVAAMATLGTVAGIHLEGPWLSATRCGAHDRAQLRDPDSAEIDGLLAAGRGTIRMVTLAPELPGSGEAIRRLVDANVVVAIGHTDASYDEARSAIKAGVTVGTHLFNGMRPLHHRDPGPALALLEDPCIAVELIADGIHVHPALLRQVIATTGCERVALITDAIAAAGLTDGSFRLGTLDVVVVSGVARLRGQSTIAGSTATMDRLFRTAVALGGDTDDALAAAVQMTSTTPARVLGFDDVGSLRRGGKADLVVLNNELYVDDVMVNGEWYGG